MLRKLHGCCFPGPAMSVHHGCIDTYLLHRIYLKKVFRPGGILAVFTMWAASLGKAEAHRSTGGWTWRWKVRSWDRNPALVSRTDTRWWPQACSLRTNSSHATAVEAFLDQPTVRLSQVEQTLRVSNCIIFKCWKNKATFQRLACETFFPFVWHREAIVPN